LKQSAAAAVVDYQKELTKLLVLQEGLLVTVRQVVATL
jgi:hypothetical protein